MLDEVVKAKSIQYRVVAVDPNESRRIKVEKIVKCIGVSPDSFQVADIPRAKQIVVDWTGGVGCNAILEVSYVPCCRSMRFRGLRRVRL